jgi:hypothetical protein
MLGRAAGDHIATELDGEQLRAEAQAEHRHAGGRGTGGESAFLRKPRVGIARAGTPAKENDKRMGMRVCGQRRIAETNVERNAAAFSPALDGGRAVATIMRETKNRFHTITLLSKPHPREWRARAMARRFHPVRLGDFAPFVWAIAPGRSAAG